MYIYIYTLLGNFMRSKDGFAVGTAKLTFQDVSFSLPQSKRSTARTAATPRSDVTANSSNSRLARNFGEGASMGQAKWRVNRWLPPPKPLPAP